MTWGGRAKGDRQIIDSDNTHIFPEKFISPMLPSQKAAHRNVGASVRVRGKSAARPIYPKTAGIQSVQLRASMLSAEDMHPDISARL